jgi:glutamine amidotransferase
VTGPASLSSESADPRHKGINIFEGINNNAFFYFIHSYYCVPTDPAVTTATTDYGVSYCAALRRGNMAAVQFHPEKSGEAGLRLLQNWLNMPFAGSLPAGEAA